MINQGIVNVSYIIATILFILALGGLSNQETARRGNWYGIIGMAIALLATIFGEVTAQYDKLIVDPGHELFSLWERTPRIPCNGDVRSKFCVSITQLAQTAGPYDRPESNTPALER